MKITDEQRGKLGQLMVQELYYDRDHFKTTSILLDIVERVLSESEGEKFDEVPLPPKMKIVEHGDGNLTVTSTGWNTIAKHYNQLIDYLQAHHGKE